MPCGSHIRGPNAIVLGSKCASDCLSRLSHAFLPLCAHNLLYINHLQLETRILTTCRADQHFPSPTTCRN